MIDAVYYSFVTITTTGYGDIVPKSDVTKILAVAEIVQESSFSLSQSRLMSAIAVTKQVRTIERYGEVVVAASAKDCA